MIHICNFITDSLIRHNIISISEKRKYLYSVYRIVSRIFFNVTIIVLSLYTRSFSFFLFDIIFRMLRKYSGGFHLNNSDACLFFSIVAIVINKPISEFAATHFNAYIFFALAIILLFFIIKISPVNHPNMHLTKIEAIAMKQKLKQESIYIFFILLIFIHVYKPLFFSIWLAICFDFVSLLISKLVHQEIEIK